MAATIIATSTAARAATYTWNGLAENGNWTGSAGPLTNWSPNFLPPSNSDVQFTLISPAATVNLQGARIVNNLTLGTLQNYTLTGGSLAVTSGIVNVNAAPAATNHTIDVPVSLGAAGVFTIANPAKLTVTQAITDGTNPFGLTIAGNGTLVMKGVGSSLNALASNGGTLDLNGGSINVRNTDGGNYGTTFNAPVTIRNGGTLTLAPGGNLQINGGPANLLTVDGDKSAISGVNLFTLGNSGTAGGVLVSHRASVSSAFLVVGGTGTGGQTATATINSGGAVTTLGNGVLGAVAGAVGVATVADDSSAWHANNMILGGFSDAQFGGTGTLNVKDGGEVSVAANTKFYNSVSSIVVDRGAYSTGQLETVSGATPTIQITDDNAAALQLTNADLGFTPIFSGTIANGPDGKGSVMKTGAGAQVFTGRNTYTGGTTVGGGVLRLDVENALAATGPVTLAAGGTLDLAGHVQRVGAFALTGGTASGVTGSTLIASSATLSSGVVAVPLSTAGSILKTTGGTATVTTPIVANAVSVLEGTLDAQAGVQGTIFVNFGALLKARGTLAGNVSGGTGTMTLTGATIVSGTTTFGGTLDVGSQTISFAAGSATQVYATTLNGGVVVAPAGFKVAGSITGAGTIVAPIASLSPGAQTIAASGGTLAVGTFAANDSLSGFTGNLVAGTNRLHLVSSGFTTLGSSATVAGGSINSINGVRVNSGASLSGYGTVTGPLDNQGTVVGGSGADALHLTGAVTGPGSFQQNVSFEGSYSPGDSPASVLFSGSTAFAATSRLKMELGGTAVGTQYDHLSSAGDLTVAGTLQVSLINGFTPLAGSTFDLLDWATLSGQFSSIQLPAISGLFWDVSHLYTDGSLSVVAPLAADFNLDGNVDAGDLTVWKASFGSTASARADGDANGDGITDGADFLVWQRQSGSHYLPGDVTVSAVTIPEPAAFVLTAFAALFTRVAARTNHLPLTVTQS